MPAPSLEIRRGGAAMPAQPLNSTLCKGVPHDQSQLEREALKAGS